jgi:hypothetical protein
MGNEHGWENVMIHAYKVQGPQFCGTHAVHERATPHTTGTTLGCHFIVFHAASIWNLMGRNGKRLLMALRFFPLFTTLERFWKFRMISGMKLGKYLATVARILREQHTICSPFHHPSFGDHPDCRQFQTVFSHPSMFQQP